MRWTNRWRRWGNNYPRRLTHRRAEIFSPFHRLFRQALTALSPAIFIAPSDIHQVNVAMLADSTRFAAISNTMHQRVRCQQQRNCGVLRQYLL
ncbi:hypothetical protein [Erwinia mallotivora]|uniref:hypothetical protein n=1 Tax=Erwinia mallotivora TaxID=69222 RepID=UPI0021BEC789|nr:hypothetical protein [Erwinia mallotivora]